MNPLFPGPGFPPSFSVSYRNHLIQLSWEVLLIHSEVFPRAIHLFVCHHFHLKKHCLNMAGGCDPCSWMYTHSAHLCISTLYTVGSRLLLLLCDLCFMLNLKKRKEKGVTASITLQRGVMRKLSWSHLKGIRSAITQSTLQKTAVTVCLHTHTDSGSHDGWLCLLRGHRCFVEPYGRRGSPPPLRVQRGLISHWH